MAAATSALASVVVPEAAAAAAGSMAANSAAAAAARAMAARAAAAGGGGNCRRPGLAWKGALSWMSGRSCWSRASRGAPSRLLPRATPSAGSVASLRSASTSGADRHGFMATLQPWPMPLARPVPTARRMRQCRIAPGRTIAPIMRTTWAPAPP